MEAVTPKQQAFLVRCVNAANAANAAGNHDAAIGWCRKALQAMPGLAEAWYQLGLGYAGKGQLPGATEALLKAAQLAGDNPDAQNSIGLQLVHAGAFAAAERCLQRALALAPRFAYAHSNLGMLRRKQRRLAEAAAAFERAIALQPDLAAAHSNLGSALNAQANFAAGETACRAAIALDPQLAAAWCNLANALYGQQRYEEARAASRRTLDLDPKYADAHVVAADILMALGEAAPALVEYEAALDLDAANLETHSERLFCLNYVAAAPPESMLAAARRFEESAARHAVPYAAWHCEREPERRLRIGMVSSDLHRHPVGYLLSGPLRELDRSAFELVAYSNDLRRDDLTRELEGRFAAWNVVIDRSDAELARQIHEDRIDILVDLSGHTAYNRLGLFAWKPAPVQATWLGYFATTGLTAIDGKIGDPRSIPPGEEAHFAERIWRLPDASLCFSPPQNAPEPSALPCATAGFTTYGCFNNLAKVNDAVVETWARVLREDGSARLFLKAKQLAFAERRDALAARFARHGIARERLILEGAGPYAEYLEAYGRVDISLDPFPYPGGMTTGESLWMGVPVVTRKGDRFIAHQGESLLHAAGLPEWIATDDPDYVRLALAAARDLRGLAQLRAGLRARVARSALFDAPRFAKHLGEAWRGMWRAWCARGPTLKAGGA